MFKVNSFLMGAVLLLMATPPLWAQVVRLTGSPPPTDRGSFGVSVDVDGDYAVVGAPFEEVDTGVVYVFFKDPVQGWTQQARLTNSDRAIGDAFGHSVDLDGAFLLIGAPGGGDEGGNDAGAAYVFFRDATAGWRQQARLTAQDPAAEDRFGYTVALSGIYAFVAAPFDDEGDFDTGAAYAYAFTGNDTWQYQDKLTAPDAEADDTFGMALALDDELALIGAPNADDPRGASAGLAYLYARSAGSTWFLRAELTASNAAAGNHFGAAVALSTDPLTETSYALIGAPEAGSRDIGAAYVFTEIDMLGTQIAQFTPGDNVSGDNVGMTVALNGRQALVGVPGADSDGFNNNTGAAYLFFNDPAMGWQERALLTAPTPEPQACFACALALDGEHLLVGAPRESGALPDAGAVYVFDPSAIFTATEPIPQPSASAFTATNYPNPFRDETTIRFDVPALNPGALSVHLTIYNALGQEVALLLDQRLRPGRHEVTWHPQLLPGGVYFYRIQIGGHTYTRVVLYVR